MTLEASDQLFSYLLDQLSAERDSFRSACKICGEATQLFDVVDLKKCCDRRLYPLGLAGVPIYYRSCGSCNFVFTTFFDDFNSDQWRLHIYNDEYAKVDPEYVDIRPRRNASEVQLLLAGAKRSTIGLDYGGGNGQTATLLRKEGWNFDTYDPFGLSELRSGNAGEYNFCSAFEVFEHSPDPVFTLSEIVRLASPKRLMVLVSTGIHDAEIRADNRLAWWYAAPRNGHISLYSRRSLQYLGQRFGLSYASVSPGTHLWLRAISEREAKTALLRAKILGRLRRAIGRR